ncbi:MAG: hypothetical protein GY829_07485, partial [Gammaproteobacteria bacterium]|nr:hypothetical protein [Gammaproteobacteria bacterium]
MPEAIQNKDGTKKQDCESNAAKRFIAKLKKDHPRQGFIICGDELMSHQPMIETIKDNSMHYLLVAKPGDHKYLFEWLNEFTELPSLETIDDRGRTHRYCWKNAVPLHGEANAVTVNFLEYQLINPEGKVTYRNSWVTDFQISGHNIVKLVQAGRCRWKIENECFNLEKSVKPTASIKCTESSILYKTF